MIEIIKILTDPDLKSIKIFENCVFCCVFFQMNLSVLLNIYRYGNVLA